MPGKETIITAHSGCDGTPDNSVEFIKAALSIGTEAFEVDVNPGADGGLFLRHDPDPAGLYRGCPALSEAFELMRPYRNVRINCDLKTRGVETAVLAAAERAGVADRLIFSGSVGLDFLRRNPGIHTTVEIYINIEEIFGTTMQELGDRLLRAPDDMVRVAEQAAEACRDLGAGVINVHHRVCTDTFLEVMAGNGIGVSAWTVNDAADISRLLGKKPANITTRQASLALALKKKFQMDTHKSVGGGTQ